jgi:hypothetical protein
MVKLTKTKFHDNSSKGYIFFMLTHSEHDEEILTGVRRGCACALTTSVIKLRVDAAYMQSGLFRNRYGGIKKSLPLLHKKYLSLNR